jgi:peptidoglycan hydrolase CwlO-like protein
MSLDDFLKLLGGLSPVLLLLIGAWLKKRADRAINDKAKADAELSRMTAEKVKAETDSLFLANAAKLVDEFRQQQAEKDALTADKLATSREKITTLESRVVRMEESFSRLRAVLATHGVWDANALVDLRRAQPTYPEPPRLPENLE